jgi:hypothetical protein
MIGGVVQLGVDGQVGGAERVVGKVGDGQRRAHGDGAGGGEIDCAPEAHVFVGRAGVPIDPVDAEIFFGGGEGFDGEDVGFAGLEKLGDIEVVGAVGAGDLG